MVQFKPMKFDRPTHIDYHFAGLPHWNAGIYLAVEDPRIWEDRRQYEKNRRHDSTTACWDDLTATCSMVLKDANGNVVLQFNKKLSELTWSRVGQGPWELYDQGAINFKPDNRRYILEVNIDPEPLLKNDVGYILIRGGGHETVSVGF